MPHLQIETTRRVAESIDLGDLLANLAQWFAAQESVEPKAVKAYARIHDHWAMGDPSRSDFLHLTVAILSGRPLDLRQVWSRSFHLMLTEAISHSPLSDSTGITVEIREMDALTYCK